MLIALQSLRLGGMNGEPQVYTEVHEDSLIALPIILPKVENTADDNVKRSTFSRPADAPDIESCKRSIVSGLSKRMSLRRVVKLAGWDNSVMAAMLCAN